MRKQNFTLRELAEYTETTLIGDPEHVIENVETLELAGPSDASFLSNPLYEKAMNKSNAGVIFVLPTITLPTRGNFLVGETPSLAFQKTAEAIHGSKRELTGFAGIHPTVIIHESAIIGKDVTIGPYVVIDKGVCIGNKTTINAHCYIGPHTVVGDECLLHSHVNIREECIIGNRVILQPGCIIGACGFGYTTNREGKHQKLLQLGKVIIGDDVEIGANSTVDRSRFKSTEIRRGTKIDNLVQIGHGVIIGEDNIIVAQTGIAGSSQTGKRVTLAGQVAVAGHLKISDNVVIAGRGGVAKSVETPGTYGGYPLLPLNDYNRMLVHMRNLDNLTKKIKELEKKLESLKATSP
ncbi:MAG: UDP-3-O-(3-hydroxymyristoyl)glucosamine N-acyltransferase [Parachlamydiaceae bacterium]|nr:UDP-3-O-(3-hydroxymyristoyl)glucosamine N-acyltransferase [Parachlamydiaceae bacterium]